MKHSPVVNNVIILSDMELEWNKFGEQRNKMYVQNFPLRLYEVPNKAKWNIFVSEKPLSSIDEPKSVIGGVLKKQLEKPNEYGLVIMCTTVI